MPDNEFQDVHDALGILPTEGVQQRPPLQIDPFAQSMLQHGANPLTEKNSLSDESIEKALAKNPGASLEDIAGVRIGGPSSAYSAPAKPNNPFSSASFPRDVSFGVPPQAQQLGFNTPALHGTRGSSWEGPPDQLKLPDDQLGVHFGNPKQAAVFSLRGARPDPNTWESPRTYPAVLQAQNPLEMRDLGSWKAYRVIDELSAINKGQATDVMGDEALQTLKPRVISPEAQGKFPTSELDKLDDIHDVRDYIASKGYDSVKYVNAVEDVGQPSHILFQDSPTKPGYVIGARSPFARFDPNQLHLPSLAAGLGGAVVYPFMPTNEDKDK